MNNLRSIALTAMVIPTTIASYQLYTDFTTNNCYECEIISDKTINIETYLFDLSLYELGLTNSSFQDFTKSVTSVHTHYEVDNVNNEKEENYIILDSFVLLEDNWDGYDAIAPKKELIELVKSFIEQLYLQPEIFPTPDGGIQLEYVIGNNQHLNIEILSKQKVNIFEMFNDRTYIEESVELDFEYLIWRINKFYGNI